MPTFSGMQLARAGCTILDRKLQGQRLHGDTSRQEEQYLKKNVYYEGRVKFGLGLNCLRSGEDGGLCEQSNGCDAEVGLCE
jgi:hypothetical protein